MSEQRLEVSEVRIDGEFITIYLDCNSIELYEAILISQNKVVVHPTQVVAKQWNVEERSEG